MAIRLQTNPTGQIARQNFSGNLFALSDSVRRLSSGLRVNTSADDSGSIIIASQLSAQASGLGQAAQNANDGIAAMQVVDASLSEAMDILGVIRTKAQSATQSGLNPASSLSVQQDITKLLGELDQLIGAATFHGLPLLTGTYTNKAFQIGAATGQTVSASLPSLYPSRIGQMRTGEMTLTSLRGGQVNLRLDNQGNGEAISVSSVVLAYDNVPEHGMGALAQAINAYSDSTGIKAQAEVSVESASPLAAGVTPGQFSINGIQIGAVAVAALDSDGGLVTAINAKTGSHGINAQVSDSGTLILSASDGRAIKVTGSGGTLGFTDAEMTTFGATRILQSGPFNLALTDASAGLAVAFSPTLRLAAPVTTTQDSTLAPDSVLGGASTLAAGWLASQDILGADLNGNITTTLDSILTAGTVLASGTILAASSVLGGALSLAGVVSTSAETVLRQGSLLASGSVIAKESYLTNAIVTTGGPLAAGQILASAVTLGDDLALSRDMLLQRGSTLAAGSQLAQASQVGGAVTLNTPLTVARTMTLAAGSTIRDLDGTTVLAAGSTMGGQAQLAGTNLTVTGSLLLKAGSTLAMNSQLGLGSTIGGSAVLSGNHTAYEALNLGVGSIIAAGSTIKSGATLTNDLVTTTGVYQSGTILSLDVVTSGSNSLVAAMTLPQDSVLAGGSTLAANTKNEAAVEISHESSLTLGDISVLSSREAATALAVVDAAIADIARIQKQAAAISDQLAGFATVQGGAGETVDLARTRVLRVDFGAEAENMTRMAMLVRTSSFALTQANAAPANVFKIMQGGSDRQASQFFIAALNRILTEGAVV